MWLLVIISLVNAAVGSRSFLFEYRLQLAGMPINILDFLLILGFAIAIFKGNSEKRMLATPHPLLRPMLIVFAIALLAGVIVGVRNLSFGLSLKRLATYIRDFAVLPMGVVVGYQLVPRLKSAYFYRYVVIVSGLLTAIVVLVFFKGKGEEFGVGSNLETLRTIDYVTPYAGIACAFVLFTILSGPRVMPTIVSVVIVGICLVGNFATLSRSDWLSTSASILSVFVLLPKGQRSSKLIRGLVLAPVLLGFLWLGVFATSKITGYDFSEKMATRIRSMLPGDQEGVKVKAWDSRWPAAVRELKLLTTSPLWGHGIGVQYTLLTEEDPGVSAGFRHNSWTCILAETGLIGFAAAVMLVGGCIVVGRRMVRDRLEPASILIGALGMVTGVQYLFLGAATNGFVNQRCGLLLALTCGIVLRTRAMQLALAHEYAGYLTHDAHDGPLVDADGVPVAAAAAGGYPHAAAAGPETWQY
jgi:hypothetical protein